MFYLIAESRETMIPFDCEGWVNHCVENLSRCLEGQDVTFDNLFYALIMLLLNKYKIILSTMQTSENEFVESPR
jgi:hypothetical protein